MWRLAIAERQRMLGLIVLGVCLLGLAAMCRPPAADECQFEQTWYAGDVHFNELIEFRADSTGTWVQDGMAGDAPHDKKEFTWQRTASRLTVSHDDRQRSVTYRIQRRGNTCYLTFQDHPFVADGSGFRHFSDSGY